MRQPLSIVYLLLTKVNQSRAQKGTVMVRGLAALAVICAGLMTSAPALAQGVGYQVISNDPNGMEIRFHGVPLRAVHADDNQNALSIDFQQPVDGAMFDHLPADVPQWISMAYANFDNGVIRSPRPVTFLTRAESDGFSLRIVPRGGPPPMMEAMVKAHIMTDTAWQEFKNLFDKVHASFFSLVKNQFQNLTETDMRTLALIKLRLNNREMAGMLGITIEGVKKAKQRFRKKIGLPEEQSLEAVIAEI